MGFEEWVRALPAPVLREFAGGGWRMREVPVPGLADVILADPAMRAVAAESHRIEVSALEFVAAMDPWERRNHLVDYPFLAH